jgi:anion-transporting  ArsA/GET3 family ATPase
MVRATKKPTQVVSGLTELLESHSVILTCGAGGVGKTTVAAATGVLAATNSSARVLVLTIDPAKRLASALGLKEVGNDAVQLSLSGLKGTLSVAMLDTSASWDDVVRRNAPDELTATKILANPLYRNITQRFVQSHDYVAMERLYELRESGLYDVIVIDTPPSRHAIDFLDAPERMADFFSSTLLKWITMPYRLGGARAGRLGYLAAKPFYQVADRILGSQFLEDIAEFFLLFQSMYDGFVERARTVSALLHAEETSFVVVSTQDPAPLEEAEYFLAELDRRGLHLGALVLNRTLPSALRDDRARAAATQLSESSDRLSAGIATTFLNYAQLAEQAEASRRRLAAFPERVVSIPLFERPLTDLAALRLLADCIR